MDPLSRTNLTPDQVTWGAFGVGTLAAGLAAGNQMVLAVGVLWFSGLLDVLDGALARKIQRSSRAGALLDMILDRMVEALFLIGLVWVDASISMAVIAFLTSVIFNFSSFLAAGALMANTSSKSMHYDPGLMERTETFIGFSAAALWMQGRAGVLWTMTGLIFFTGILRFIKIRKALKNIDETEFRG